MNYYSRYNRVKEESKKEIPSLYSLLSIQTLNKLAEDASISLQMISLYNNSKRVRQIDLLETQSEEERGNSLEYLSANKNPFNYHSLHRSLENDQRTAFSPNLKESRESKLKSSENKNDKTRKQAYLENLVRQVREKSLQRVKDSMQIVDFQKKSNGKKGNSLIKNKKSTRKPSPNRRKILKQPIQQPVINSNEQSNKQLASVFSNFNQESHQNYPLTIQNKLIKSLIKQNAQKLKDLSENSKQVNSKYVNKKDFHGEYVESIEDEDNDDKGVSGQSIVIERLNMVGIKMSKKPNMKEYNDEKQCKNDEQSKEDNPSSQKQRQSEIESYSDNKHKSHHHFDNKIHDGNQNTHKTRANNLIQLELSHSQSQIVLMQKRVEQEQTDFRKNNDDIDKKKEIYNDQQHPENKGQQLFIHSQGKQAQSIHDDNEIQQDIQKKNFSRFQDVQKVNIGNSLRQEQKKSNILLETPVSFSQHTVYSHPDANLQTNIQFLSQINTRIRSIEEPPYEHPLQRPTNLSLIIEQEQRRHKSHQNQTPTKKSFKKIMLANRELNARLVTSTILNEKNTNSPNNNSPNDVHLGGSQSRREFANNLYGESYNEQNQSPQLSSVKREAQKLSREKSIKKNFKKTVIIASRRLKNSSTFQPYEVYNLHQDRNNPKNKSFHLQKLENIRLLQGFFNDNSC